MWRSPPPSIFGLAGIGYGPLSDSSAYSNDDAACASAFLATTWNGMPIGRPS